MASVGRLFWGGNLSDELEAVFKLRMLVGWVPGSQERVTVGEEGRSFPFILLGIPVWLSGELSFAEEAFR